MPVPVGILGMAVTVVMMLTITALSSLFGGGKMQAAITGLPFMIVTAVIVIQSGKVPKDRRRRVSHRALGKRFAATRSRQPPSQLRVGQQRAQNRPVHHAGGIPLRTMLSWSGQRPQ